MKEHFSRHKKTEKHFSMCMVTSKIKSCQKMKFKNAKETNLSNSKENSNLELSRQKNPYIVNELKLFSS